MWARVAGTRVAHLVVDGTAVCGSYGIPPYLWQPSEATRCLRCRWRSGDRSIPMPWRPAPRRRRGVLPAGEYAGPDPLVDVIREHGRSVA